MYRSYLILHTTLSATCTSKEVKYLTVFVISIVMFSIIVYMSTGHQTAEHNQLPAGKHWSNLRQLLQDEAYGWGLLWMFCEKYSSPINISYGPGRNLPLMLKSEAGTQGCCVTFILKHSC